MICIPVFDWYDNLLLTLSPN